ncbi:MAG: rRNA adenine N-6-methyltransferase family protein [Nitrososphaeria archaeon]
MSDLRFLKEYYVNQVLKHVPASRKVFEIGAGYGNFTIKLASISKQVRVFEINPKLFRILQRKISSLKNVIAINDDAFKYVPEIDEIVFTDLPFSRSRDFIVWLSKNVVMEVYAIVQSEFYEKISSAPGNKNYTGVSVLFNLLFEHVKVMDIPSDAYIPTPRVHATFFIAKRKSTITLTDEQINKVLTLMNRRNSSSATKPGRKLFQLSPEEILDEARVVDEL